jgi:hypothetical protein
MATGNVIDQHQGGKSRAVTGFVWNNSHERTVRSERQKAFHESPVSQE